MFNERIAVLFLILCTLKLSNSYPASPGQNILKSFYEYPKTNFVQGKLIQLTRPEPIVDTIKESEKCCNTQQHLPGKKLLGVYENISSALSNVVEVPKQAKNKIGATVTSVLNNIGGIIVGFQE